MLPNAPTDETMSEGSPMPPTPDGDMDEGQEPQAMGENQVCVDLASLSMPDENDEQQTPQMGEKVQLNIEGTVDRIEGDKAYVTMHAVNGNEVEPDEDDEQAQENSIRGDIAQLPEGY